MTSSRHSSPYGVQAHRTFSVSSMRVELKKKLVAWKFGEVITAPRDATEPQTATVKVTSNPVSSPQPPDITIYPIEDKEIFIALMKLNQTPLTPGTSDVPLAFLLKIYEKEVAEFVFLHENVFIPTAQKFLDQYYAEFRNKDQLVKFKSSTFCSHSHPAYDFLQTLYGNLKNVVSAHNIPGLVNEDYGSRRPARRSTRMNLRRYVSKHPIALGRVYATGDATHPDAVLEWLSERFYEIYAERRNVNESSKRRKEWFDEVEHLQSFIDFVAGLPEVSMVEDNFTVLADPNLCENNVKFSLPYPPVISSRILRVLGWYPLYDPMGRAAMFNSGDVF